MHPSSIVDSNYIYKHRYVKSSKEMQLLDFQRKFLIVCKHIRDNVYIEPR